MARPHRSRTRRVILWLLPVATGVALVVLNPSPALAITVAERSPIAGAAGVAVTTNVTVTFDLPATGVDNSTFTLARTAGSVAVPATVTGVGTSWTLDPGADLEPRTSYTVALADTIGDADGRTLLVPESWSFTTEAPPPPGDTEAPVVTNRLPEPGERGVDVRTDVSATFSESVQGVDDETFTLVARGGEVVTAAVDRVGATNRWILDPAGALVEDTTYTAGLSGGPAQIRDEAGNPLTDTEWSFSTAGEEEPGGDLRRPRLVNEFPRGGATGVSRFTDVRAHFNEAVRRVNTRTFRLVHARRGFAVAADVVRTRRSHRWVLDPDRRLARGTRYVAVLRGARNGIEDLAGNNLSTTRWSFRTSR